MLEVNKNPDEGDLRQFGIAMLGGFVVLGVLLWGIAWFKAEPARGLFVWSGAPVQYIVIAMWFVGLFLFALSRVSLEVSRAVYVPWMTVAMVLGVIMSNILLTVLYFTLLIPFTLIRLSDPMRRKLGGQTYWEDAKPYEPTLDRMRRPF